jgi:acetyl-CoA carboxylase biotin carboxyl carrier protein
MALKIDESVFNKLAEILERHGLTEIEYRYGDTHIKMSVNREPLTHFVQAPIAAVQQIQQGGVSSSSSPPPAESTSIVALNDLPNNEISVKSPMVGVCYLSPEPGAANFVNVRDSVIEGQPLFIIESMKVMNLIKSPNSGVITRIEASNGSPVEYGQVIMIIEPS